MLSPVRPEQTPVRPERYPETLVPAQRHCLWRPCPEPRIASELSISLMVRIATNVKNAVPAHHPYLPDRHGVIDGIIVGVKTQHRPCYYKGSVN